MSRKRPGDPGNIIARHPLNKKKRIGLEHMDTTTMNGVFSQLSDETKTEIFNTMAKSAFPEYNDLLMAAWNVLSIYIHVGSENLSLHESIGEMHDVLQAIQKHCPRPMAAGSERSGTAGKISYDHLVDVD